MAGVAEAASDKELEEAPTNRGCGGGAAVDWREKDGEGDEEGAGEEVARGSSERGTATARVEEEAKTAVSGLLCFHRAEQTLQRAKGGKGNGPAAADETLRSDSRGLEGPAPGDELAESADEQQLAEPYEADEATRQGGGMAEARPALARELVSWDDMKARGRRSRRAAVGVGGSRDGLVVD